MAPQFNGVEAVFHHSILLGPYEPITGFRVAIIEDGGFPIELIESALTDDELWGRRETENLLYED